MSHPRSTSRALVYALAFAWIVGKAALFRERVPAGIPPDEPVHVSYVAYLESTGRLVPRYEEMRLLDGAGRFGPLPVNIAHPSAYYALIGGLDRLSGDAFSAPLTLRTRRLRRASAPLFAAASALFLYVGFRRVSSLAAHALFAATVATVPPFAFVGSAVNNDVLAFLAGGITLLGLARLLEARAGALSGSLIGAGLALALLSKATAALLVLLAVAGGLALSRRVVSWERDARFVLSLLPWLLLPAFHYVPVLVRYGTPLPTLDVVDPEAFARSAFVESADGPRLPVAEWGGRTIKVLGSTWLSLISHAWIPVGPPWSLAGPALLLALAFVGLGAPARDGEAGDRPGLALARIAAASAALTLALNVVWARRGYLETGRLGGIHARYYLPLLPGLALAVSYGLGRVKAPGAVVAALVGLLVLFDAGVTARYLALFEP